MTNFQQDIKKRVGGRPTRLANYQGAGGQPARRAIFRAGGQPARRVNISELAGNQLVGQNFDYTK